jgi:hypothetical protein
MSIYIIMSLNTVNVIAIDEEKLKFRVSVSFSAPNIAQGQGTYKFLLPAPTNIANSDHYNQCTVKCAGFAAYCDGVADPVWTSTAALHKSAAIELTLDIPSSQTSRTTNVLAATNLVGNTDLGGYKEMIFLDCISIGGGNGVDYALANAAGGGGIAACWRGKSDTQPILCGNPFGKSLTIRNVDPIIDAPLWLQAMGAANGADLGLYIYQFDIVMVPNN